MNKQIKQKQKIKRFPKIMFLIVTLIIISSVLFVALVASKAQFYHQAEKEFELTVLKKDWRIDEEPEFKIRQINRDNKTDKQGVIGELAADVAQLLEEKPKVAASLIEPLDNEIALEEAKDFTAKKLFSTKIKIFKQEDLHPGLYKLRVNFEREGETYNLEEDFRWGVLAINTNKSIYLPNETAYLQIAVLREDGHTVCDANLKLKIKNEKLKIETELSTEDGTIQYSGQCGPDNVTDKPDYFAFYQVKEPGIYQMKLTNLDTGYEIIDSFEVRKSLPFEVERIGPTRIYPPAEYEMRLKIKANQDFSGEVKEYLPDSFEINLKSQNANLKTTAQKSKLIIWQVDWEAGKSYELSYQFKAPNISPFLYLLGPLKFEKNGRVPIFREGRQWQIGADSPGLNLEVPLEMVDYGVESAAGTGTNAPARTSIYLDPSWYDGATYYFEIVAQNTDTAAKNVILRDATNLVDKVTISVPAGTSAFTRFRSAAWTPATGKLIYRVKLAQTTSAAQLVIQTARIIVKQTNATKTRIQIPLVQRGYNAAGAPAIGTVDSTISTTYVKESPVRYSLWKKDISKYADLIATNPWTFEAVLGSSDASGSAYAALFNATDDTQVSGTEIYVSGDTDTLKDISFADNATNFHNLDNFEVRIKSSSSLYTAYLRSAARLYVSLTNLKRAEVFYRISRAKLAGTAAVNINEQRVLLDTSLFTNPTVYLEASGYCADNGQRVFLRDHSTNDSGTDGSDVSGSGINFNSGTQSIVRTSMISPTSGNRFYIRTTASTNNLALNHVWLVVQFGESSFNQSAYRWFNNLDSTDVGTALAAQDTAATLGSVGASFRLRMLLHISNASLSLNGKNFKLQFINKGTGTCASPSGGTPSTWTDITTSTLIAFYDNPSISDSQALTANANDPTHGTDSIVNQTYEELNNFTNAIDSIPSGADGKWDFALYDNGAPAGTTYCLRAVKSDGTALDTYTYYPEITTFPFIFFNPSFPGKAKINTPIAGYGPQAGLVGHWTFDGPDTNWTSATSGTTTDKSGNNYTGTLTNMSRSSSPAVGISGQGLSFDGIDDYVDIGTGPSTVRTVCFWVFPLTTTEYFINLNGTSTYIWANAGTVTATGFSNPTIYVNGQVSSAISANKWQFVTVTDATAVDANNLDLGRTQDTNYLEGKMDEIRLYNYVLSTSEIEELYRLGSRKIQIRHSSQ